MVGILKRATGTSGLPNQFDTGPDWDWVSSVGGQYAQSNNPGAAALASLALFIAMIAIWTQVLGIL
jgi:hypothetical protein